MRKLHNRSSEPCSLEVALAAFFKEEGSVKGLRDAISSAAEWDEQVSQGRT